jgi:uncharacterized protein
MQGQSAGRDMLLIGVLAIVLTACQSTGEATFDERPSTNNAASLGNSRQLTQIEKLVRDQQYAAAAQEYEELAQRSTPDIRDRLLLRAAREWLHANELTRGETLYRQVANTLPASDAALRAIVAARIAMATQRPGQALDELDRIVQPWPRDDIPEILELRAQAQFALGKPVGAVMTALDRERLLSDSAAILRNRRMIWDGVQRSVASGANLQVPAGSSRAVAGWLELGTAALAANRNPFAAHPAFDTWRSKYPEHPANEFLNQYVMPQLRVAVTLPSQIAVVLPLSGPQQVAGQVVRDGLIAAVLQQPSDISPRVRIYDSAAGGVVAAYTQAVAEGAKFVVGPLLKEDVATLAASQQITVPTLVLNSLPDQTTLPNLFQFWPDPADEARQVARRIAAQGLTHGIAIVPKNDKGDRVYRAFAEEFQRYNGKVVGSSFYDLKARDFREPVTAALLVNESNARYKSLSSILGTKMEFEARARSDVQFVFIGADAAQGRLLRPTIRFHSIEQVPIFATSDIYEPDATAKANVDLDGVSFPDMPWLIAPDEQAVQLRAALNRYWPGRARDRARLYALGFDTFRLIPLLLSQATGTPTNQSNGVTGKLSIDSSGHVHRELEWARIVNGQPQLLESNPINTLAPTASIR